MAASASRAIYKSNTRSETTLTAGARAQGRVRCSSTGCHIRMPALTLAFISEPRLSSPQQHIPAQDPLNSQGFFLQQWHLTLPSPHSGDTHANCQALSLCSCLLGSLPGTGSAHMAAVKQGWHGQRAAGPKTAVLECSVFCHGKGWPKPPL